jgi:hypothetical protein
MSIEIQIVYSLRQKKAKDPLSMLPAHEFLRDLNLPVSILPPFLPCLYGHF